MIGYNHTGVRRNCWHDQATPRVVKRICSGEYEDEGVGGQMSSHTRDLKRICYA